VIPETLGALLLFVLCVVPGMLFELLRQHQRPPFEQTSLEEASRILLWSVLLDLAGVGFVAALRWLGAATFASPAAIARDGLDAYWRGHYSAVVFTIAVVLAVGLTIAALVHRSLNRADRRGLALRFQRWIETRLGHVLYQRMSNASVWQEVLATSRPVGADTMVTVLKKDGSLWTGRVGGFTPTDHEDRDLALKHPISVRRPGAAQPESLASTWELVVISGREISELFVGYASKPTTAAPPRGASPSASEE